MQTNFKLMNSTFLLLLFSFLACQEDIPDMPSDTGILYFNAKIYTVNPDQVWAEAMHVKNGKINFIGTNEEAEVMAKDAEQIDLEGAFIMPGIHDVHMHPLEAASQNFNFLLSEDIEDPEDFADDVLFAIEENPEETWLLGWGHDLGTILEAERPPKEILDDVAPNRPVAIMEKTSHSLWVNSKALEFMEITNDTENPMGGVIMREENGEANGILIDNAGNMLLNMVLTASPEREEADYNGLVNTALPELAKHGITSVCDARTYWKRNHHKTWKRVANEGKLTARVNLGLWLYPSENDASQIETLKSLYEFKENGLLKINQIKLYCDGIIHNTTSAMHDDYLIDYFEESTNNGLNYVTESRIATYIRELEPTGFDFHIHAIGNRGIHEGLNAIEQSGSSNGRHRLTHVEFVDPADYSRFATLNVTADAQVAGDFTQPEHWHENDYLIGADLNNNNVPIKSLWEANARVTLSSDWDVSTLNPFVGMQNAVTRTPQNLTLEQAIEAYTIKAAYVMRQENIVGSLETGKEADFIVLDKNPFEIPATDIHKIEVLETYLQGELIFEK